MHYKVSQTRQNMLINLQINIYLRMIIYIFLILISFETCSLIIKPTSIIKFAEMVLNFDKHF